MAGDDTTTLVEAEQKKLEAMLDKGRTVDGIRIRPFTAGNLIRLQLVGNPLVDSGTCNPEEQLYHVASFLFIHSAPIEEVNRAIEDRKTFKGAVLNFMDQVNIRDVPKVAEEIGQIIRNATIGTDYEVENEGPAPN